MPDTDSSTRTSRPLLLACGVKHYDWGQTGPGAFIPEFLSLEPGDQPWAELWAGAHPALPSGIKAGGPAGTTLSELIDRDPQAMLGPAAAQRYGNELPYLFKILAASRPLSIQAHPDLKRARLGFAREEESGLDRGDELRNFRDHNDKPEIICAYTDFYALCGFRPLDEIKKQLSAIPELFIPGPTGNAVRMFTGCTAGCGKKEFREFFSRLMCAPAEEISAILVPLLERLREKDAGRKAGKDELRHWILRANAKRKSAPDRGTLAMFFLNLVSLKPGQSLFLAPGMPHSYLEGVGIELTGNSDNVLRAGLTSKPVDMDAFLDTIDLSFSRPTVYGIEAKADGSLIYPIPFDGMELGRIELDPGRTYERGAGHGPELLVCMEGVCTIAERDGKQDARLEIEKGGIAFIPAALGGYAVCAGTGGTSLFRAATSGAAGN